MVLESVHVSTTIDRPADEVYAYASDPENLSTWAAGLAHQEIELADGVWVVDSPMGRVTVAFAPPNVFGILDHEVTLPSGEAVSNPMRVIPNGDGCDVVFTVRRRDGMSANEFTDDTKAVAADLATLRDLMQCAGLTRAAAHAVPGRSARPRPESGRGSSHQGFWASSVPGSGSVDNQIELEQRGQRGRRHSGRPRTSASPRRLSSSYAPRRPTEGPSNSDPIDWVPHRSGDARGFAWSPDGSLYLALAGSGGETRIEVAEGFTLEIGLSSSVATVADGGATPVASGLVSAHWVGRVGCGAPRTSPSWLTSPTCWPVAPDPDLLRVTPSGEIATVADLSEAHMVPTGIAVDAEGNAYVGFETTRPPRTALPRSSR